MTHKLTDIDPDGVMPKKKFDEITLAEKHRCEGYNHSCTDHQQLSVEIDVEELANAILQRSLMSMERAKLIAEYIAQNPKILRIVRLSHEK